MRVHHLIQMKGFTFSHRCSWISFTQTSTTILLTISRTNYFFSHRVSKNRVLLSELASFADVLLTRHAIFPPNERRSLTRKDCVTSQNNVSVEGYLNLNLQPISSPEAAILLVCARNRDLWAKLKARQKDGQISLAV